MKNNSKFNRGSVNSILVAIIAAIVIIAVAYFFYEKGKSAQVSQVNDQSLASTPINTEVSTSTNILTPSSTSTLQTSITILSPKGGETFNAGQQVVITWQDTIKLPSVNIMVVSNTADKCSAYTNNGSMATCRGYGIYTGPDTGSFTWTVPTEYPDAGQYLIRIWPGSPESVRAFEHEGYNVDSYSNYFTISNE